MGMTDGHVIALGEESYAAACRETDPVEQGFFAGVEAAARWIADGKVTSRNMSRLVGAVRAREEVDDTRHDLVCDHCQQRVRVVTRTLSRDGENAHCPRNGKHYAVPVSCH